MSTLESVEERILYFSYFINRRLAVEMVDQMSGSQMRLSCRFFRHASLLIHYFLFVIIFRQYNLCMHL